MNQAKVQHTIKKLLACPEGRKALGVEEAPQKAEKPKPRLRVAVLMPSYKLPHALTWASMQEMVMYSRQFIDVFIPQGVSSSVIHWSRNLMVAQLYQMGQTFDYVLFADDDMTFEPDALMKLLSHGKDIIGGICVRRQDPPMPTIRHLGKDFRYSTIVKWDMTTPLLEVDAVGTGFLLISRAALESIGEYFLRCGFERQTFGRMFNAAYKAGNHNPIPDHNPIVVNMEEELAVVERNRRDFYRKSSNAQWFQFLPQFTGEGEFGEDISFCLKAKLCGLPIFVDNTVQPGHVGDYVYSLSDYLAHQGLVVPQSEVHP